MTDCCLQAGGMPDSPSSHPIPIRPAACHTILPGDSDVVTDHRPCAVTTMEPTLTACVRPVRGVPLQVWPMQSRRPCGGTCITNVDIIFDRLFVARTRCHANTGTTVGRSVRSTSRCSPFCVDWRTLSAVVVSKLGTHPLRHVLAPKTC